MSAMWFDGRMRYPDSDKGFEVLRAKQDGNKICLDWMEQGEPGLIEATSLDGRTYRGSYCYPKSGETGTTELEMIQEKGEHVLRGFWAVGSEAGDWEFRLSRTKAPRANRVRGGTETSQELFGRFGRFAERRNEHRPAADRVRPADAA